VRLDRWSSLAPVSPSADGIRKEHVHPDTAGMNPAARWNEILWAIDLDDHTEFLAGIVGLLGDELVRAD
jgi:hypothetical protein